MSVCCDQPDASRPEDEEQPRCRYCFEVEEKDSEDKLVSPCACRGNQGFTHQSCLIKWQRRQGRGKATCEVCKTPWTIQLDALDRECFVKAVRTNPRYPPVDESALNEDAQAALDPLMSPGNLILQTPPRAEQALNMQMQGAQYANPASPSSTLSLFTFMLLRHRQKHWLHGTYLIISRGDRDASDSSDSIVAVNLARLATRDDFDAEATAELQPLREALAPAVPPLLLGGPCNQSQPICLIELSPGGATPSVRGDVLPVPLVATADALRAARPPEAAAAEEEPCAAAPEDTPLPAGPPPNAATTADAPADASTDASADASVDANAPPPRIFVAEPAVAASIVRAHGAERTRVVIVQGCAVWSTEQLLSEISRHKWGLARSACTDVPFGSAAPRTRARGTLAAGDETIEVDDDETEEARPDQTSGPATPAVWQACWLERRPICTAGMPSGE